MSSWQHAELHLPYSLEQAAERCLLAWGSKDGFCLMQNGDPCCAKEHLLVGLEPHLELAMPQPVGPYTSERRRDALQQLREFLPTDNDPACCGGHIAYEFGGLLEALPPCPADPRQLPALRLFRFRTVARFTSAEGGTAVRWSSDLAASSPWWHAEPGDLDKLAPPAGLRLVESSPMLHCRTAAGITIGRVEYDRKIHRIRELIRAGDVYQINYTVPFSFPLDGSPQEFNLRLRRTNPAAYACSICTRNSAGEQLLIAGASPELFFHCRDGDALCSPIKGTAPRGMNEQEDLANEHRLRESIKDRAELAMIVDLVRNDLSRVCRVGSVQVAAHARVERLPRVLHLVSDVCGTLSDGKDTVDLLAATFPCGSITGAPKIAAMMHITALEQRARGVYTGATGFITRSAARLAVAIRTAVVDAKAADVTFGSGGGIVIDSVAAKEYDELVLKATSFTQAL